MKLSKQQIEFFHTFGYLMLDQLFTPDEMARIAREADELLAERRDPDRDPAYAQAESPFIEHRASLSWLADDDRIHGPLAQLLGEDFVWGGSEGHRTGSDEGANHLWHCDRRDCVDLDLIWIKCMLYLQPMIKDAGALRVLPGSHVPSYSRRLMPLDVLHLQSKSADELYGVRAEELPCTSLETRPGDLVVFNQLLFHGVFNKQPNRRYLAMKFIQRPTTGEQIEACRRHIQGADTLHDAFRASDRPRIRRMVDGLIAAEQLATVR